MVTYDDSGDGDNYQFWQKKLTRLKVRASKDRLGNPVREYEDFIMTLNRIPWEGFTPEERVAIAVPGLDSVDIAFNRFYVDNGFITERTANGVVLTIASVMFNRITLTDDPLYSANVGMTKSSLEEDVEGKTFKESLDDYVDSVDRSDIE